MRLFTFTENEGSTLTCKRHYCKPDYHAACLYKDEAQLEARLGEILCAQQPAPGGLAEAMGRYSWTTLSEQYDRLFSAVAH